MTTSTTNQPSAGFNFGQTTTATTKESATTLSTTQGFTFGNPGAATTTSTNAKKPTVTFSLPSDKATTTSGGSSLSQGFSFASSTQNQPGTGTTTSISTWYTL